MLQAMDHALQGKAPEKRRGGMAKKNYRREVSEWGIAINGFASQSMDDAFLPLSWREGSLFVPKNAVERQAWKGQRKHDTLNDLYTCQQKRTGTERGDGIMMEISELKLQAALNWQLSLFLQAADLMYKCINET